MPGECRDVFFMPFQEADVSHHLEIENTSGLVSGTRCQQLTSVRLKRRFCNGVLMTV